MDDGIDSVVPVLVTPQELELGLAVAALLTHPRLR
jgi:hypothetical protein